MVRNRLKLYKTVQNGHFLPIKNVIYPSKWRAWRVIAKALVTWINGQESIIHITSVMIICHHWKWYDLLNQTELNWILNWLNKIKQTATHTHPWIKHCQLQVQIIHRTHFCNVRLKKINSMSQSCPALLFLIFFFLLGYFLFSFFINLFDKIYMKSYDRHNKTLWTTDFFNSVSCFVACSSKNQVSH